VFVNLADNHFLDSQGFTPFGTIQKNQFKRSNRKLQILISKVKNIHSLSVPYGYSVREIPFGSMLKDGACGCVGGRWGRERGLL
jgi:hypothetical protein